MDFKNKAEEVWAGLLKEEIYRRRSVEFIATSLEQAYREGGSATEARIKKLEDCLRKAREVLDGMYNMNYRGGWISVAPIVDKAIREIDVLLSKSEEVKK
jgi:hypothetical protein